ncbi:MAG: dienelactone hydrolase family protein [Pseudoclavibacter sp.]|nr:dienelactone hydrolase family protein [Pseudoclavibacter sp.]
MTTVVLFHHALGVTPSLHGIAAELRRAGHTVYLPDLFAGRVFDTIPRGVAHAQEIGFPELLRRGRDAAEELPARVVYAGVSLGAVPAQALAQTRPGALGAFLVSAALPFREYGEWPAGVPVEVHAAEHDEFFVEDRTCAEELVAHAERASLVLYTGSGHLFAEEGHRDYDAENARLLMERFAAFLDAVDATARR